ncbi:T-cell surface glycoprotein CD8 alpha chain [Cololabis saira]|uniref:T-cell surface glycoprotein CD8 alpha chain n=1 Tax=Cololabis saira TaxID=129043 RepID=UPI002AD2D0F4|nr:T-cell surface glycoprotein CD8 alpha chain [Cololabis saira]
MDQKWIQILVILVSYQQVASGVNEPVTLKEGVEYELNCKPAEVGTMVVWFRVSDKSGMEFIASFSNSGQEKKLPPNFSSLYSYRKSAEHFHLKVKAFRRDRDSGLYSCASLYKGIELKFGEVTQLRGDATEVRAPPTTTRAPSTSTTAATKCACEAKNKPGERRSSMFCAPLILGPLAGGCGLLLLLLLITILYCNRIRTRRCPHHYKRKPRMVPPEKMMMTNRPV